MITLSDIALHLGVSTATVSNALRGKGRISPDRRALIQKTAADMGYVLSSISENPQENIVVITEQVNFIFIAEILSGITKEGWRTESVYPIYDLGILTRRIPREADGEALAPLVQKVLERLSPYPTGIIYISQYPRDIHGLFQDTANPVLFVFGTGEGDQAAINYDDQQGASLAVSHLIASGRKRIAMLSGPIDSKSMNDRLYGYQRTLIEHKMVFEPSLVFIGDWGEKSGYQRTLELIRMDKRPDAIFAQNDGMASGAFRALAEHGIRVPEDIAVIGFDNNVALASATRPELSSIAPPFSQMGQTAVTLMRAMLRGEAPREKKILLPCTLAQRKSC